MGGRKRSARMDVLNFLAFDGAEIELLALVAKEKEDGQAVDDGDVVQDEVETRPRSRRKKRCAKGCRRGPNFYLETLRLLYWHHQARKSLSLSTVSFLTIF